MSYGFEVKNDYGRVQADTEFINFANEGSEYGKITAGAIVVTTINNRYVSREFNTFYYETSLIGFRPPPTLYYTTDAGNVYLPAPPTNMSSFLTYINGSVVQYRGFRLEIPRHGRITVPWKAFKAKQTVNSSHGIVLYNENSDICFSSDTPQMKIVGVYTGTMGPQSLPTSGYGILGSNPTDITVQDAVNNYFIHLPTSWIGWYSGGVMKWFYRGIGRLNNTTLRVNIARGNATHPGSTYRTHFWNPNFTILEIEA